MTKMEIPSNRKFRWLQGLVLLELAEQTFTHLSEGNQKAERDLIFYWKENP